MSRQHRHLTRFCRGCHRGISRSVRTCPMCLSLNLKRIDYLLLALFAAVCTALVVWAAQDWASYYGEG